MTEVRATRLLRTASVTGGPAVRATRLLRVTTVALGEDLRDVTAATVTEAQRSSGATMVVFVQLDFDVATHYLWTGVGTISWNGNDWQGVGDVGEVSAVEESSDLAAQAVTLTLSSVKPAFLAVAASEDTEGRRVRVWRGFLGDDGALVVDPVLLLDGRASGTPQVTLGESGKIELTVENRLQDWDRANGRRYTDVDQQRVFPGDLGLLFMSRTVEAQIPWGGKDVGGAGGGQVSGNTGSSVTPDLSPSTSENLGR